MLPEELRADVVSEQLPAVVAEARRLKWNLTLQARRRAVAVDVALSTLRSLALATESASHPSLAPVRAALLAYLTSTKPSAEVFATLDAVVDFAEQSAWESERPMLAAALS